MVDSGHNPYYQPPLRTVVDVCRRKEGVLRIEGHCSRLTESNWLIEEVNFERNAIEAGSLSAIEAGLLMLNRLSEKVNFDNAIEAGSLVSNWLSEEVDFDDAIEAGSLVLTQVI